MDNELNPGAPGDDKELDNLETHIKNAVSAICSDDTLDLKAKVKKIKAALKLLDEGGEDEEVEEDDEEDSEEEEKKTEESVRNVFVKHTKGADRVKALKAIRESIKAKHKAKGKKGTAKSLREQLNATNAKLDSVTVKLATRDRSDLAARLIAEAKLPAIVVTKTFLTQLSEAKDESAMKALVEDRKQLASIQTPRSTGPVNVNGGKAPADITTKSFAESLKGR